MTAEMLGLELFACEGCATVGYTRAGFSMVANDLDANRLRYNTAAVATHHGDALHLLDRLLDGGPVRIGPRFYRLTDFVFGHGSPPCQGYTRGNAGKVTAWPKLIPDVRERFEATGLPYVIENVEHAAPFMVDPVKLCGCMFDLKAPDSDGVMLHLLRPRLFETNFDLAPPRPCDHAGFDNVAGVYGGGRKATNPEPGTPDEKRRPGESLASVAPRDRYAAKHVRKGGYTPRSKEVAAALLRVEHATTWQGLKESIPPAYAEHVGRAVRRIA